MAEKEWALVTGAASGIGAELCRLFARDGSDVVLVDRDESGLVKMSAELEQKFGIRTLSLVYDLSMQEAPEKIFQELHRKEVRISALVNNAGFGTYGNFWETDLHRDKALVNVNILAYSLLY